jgi:hypothetical protein
MRNAGITDPITGKLVRLPYMPRVADLPPGWRRFTTAQKIEHLIGLDRCRAILSWGSISEVGPLRFSFQMQVMRILLRIGLKAMLDGTLSREAARDRDKDRILGEFIRRFEEAARK